MAASIQHSQRDSFAARLLRGEGVPVSGEFRYALAALVFVLALAARFAMLPEEAGLGFLTFYPAVALSALLFGSGPGLLSIALGAVAAHYFFMPPYWAFKWRLDHLLSVVTFCFSGAIICLITHQMRRHAQDLKLAMAELNRSKDELAQANSRLQSLDRAKTEFFSNISHEFRTPLTLILGPLDQLLAQPSGELPGELGDTVKLVRRNALRLLRLVNALLDFSRLEAGRATPQWDAVDLSTYTADLASNFRSACEKGGLALIVDCPALPRPVVVDRAMWEKIVFNLLSNAFKFTLKGSIHIQMRGGVQDVALVVRDTGVGISAHNIPHLFERFHRIAGVHGRSVEGSGIGLALTAELVRLHGGTIEAESQEGRGSAFIVRVPYGHDRLDLEHTAIESGALTGLAEEALEEMQGWLPEAVNHTTAQAATPAHTRGRIVLADDNQDMRSYIRRMLEAAGYTVDAVDCGDMALAKCQAHIPDAVLTDVMMPGMNGFELLQRLRQSPATATLPVILLSARAGEEARVEGLTAGADDYLVKPFGARELMARVDGVMKLAALRNEAQRKQQLYMAELERSNQALLDFAYAASHDLKEPLRGLHNYATFLREDYAHCLGDDGKEYLNRMQRLVERASALIDGLLSYSKLGASAMRIERVPLDRIVDEVLDDLRPFLAGKGVRIERATPLPQAECDTLLVRTIFQNLISNAAKYNDKEDKRIAIGCSQSNPPVLYVRDNGIGIAAQHHANIFRIFKRLHEQDKFGGGTGVGLTIVKKLIERHGGRIWLESSPGMGTTFFFTLEGER